ncbi:hypothetical protein C8R45DRAFT_964616 [Mycena sanguinolenta]|nr:hypothetical protein C8R45DRAFT_964616 [Mycena sanguinolenta]
MALFRRSFYLGLSFVVRQSTKSATITSAVLRTNGMGNLKGQGKSILSHRQTSATLKLYQSTKKLSGTSRGTSSSTP